VIAFLKFFVNSTIGTPNMKPLDQLITSGSAPVLNIVTPTAPFLANSQVFTASGTFTAPKDGIFYVTLIGHGGAGGAGGNYANNNAGNYNHGGDGGKGGSGYIKLRVPVAMTAGQQTAATIGANTTFGSITVANGTNGNGGQGAGSNQGGRGGDGGRGAVPGDGGTGGYTSPVGGEARPDGANGVVSPLLFPPLPYILSSDARQVLGVFGVPEIVATYLNNGGSGGRGGDYPDDYGAPKPGSAGGNGAIIIEWD
jgi:hypothetical protein